MSGLQYRLTECTTATNSLSLQHEDNFHTLLASSELEVNAETSLSSAHFCCGNGGATPAVQTSPLTLLHANCFIVNTSRRSMFFNWDTVS